jgi:hypothetical protein
MLPIETFFDKYGLMLGLVAYIVIRDVIPFIFGKLIPGRIESVETQRKARAMELSSEREWQHKVEQDRQSTLAEIAKAVQVLSTSMVQTNINITQILTNQERIQTNQSLHHDEMMGAIGDMRAATAVIRKKRSVQ